MSEQSLKQKTVNGMGWSAIDQVSRMGISFVVGIILARLLSPDEYGLIGILAIFISVFTFLCDSGFTNALIRKKDIKDIDYYTVFYINLGLSLLLALILFISAPLIALFFERSELIALTRVMSSVVIINALAMVQRVRLTKKVDFKTQTKITIVASAVSGAIGIVMAYTGCGVWALVGQQITAQGINTTLLWIYNRWIPKIEFSMESFKEMWSFGWKLLVSGLIDTTWTEIYQVVIGKCYTPATLGLYTRATQFTKMFSSNLNNVIQRVSFPVLAEMQDDRIRLKNGYKRVIRCTMLPTFVLMMGLAACAKPMILFLIGEKWEGCVHFIQLVSFYSMLYPLHSLNLNMLQVQGRSDIFLKLEIIKKIVAVGPILLGIFIDIYWMIGGSVIVGFFAYYLNAKYSGPFLNYSIKEQIKDILPSFFVASAMAIPVYAMSYLPITSYVLFPLQLIVSAIIVVTICEVVKLPEYIEIKGVILPLVGKIKRCRLPLGKVI